MSQDHKQLTVITPPGVEGHAVVTALNPDGGEASLVGGFVYLPMLQVSLVAPASGPVTGGTQVEVSGAGFHRGATVTFNGTEATEVRVVAPGRLVAVTPEGSFGPADVVVTNPDGQRAFSAGAFLYSRLAVSRRVGRHDPQSHGESQPTGVLAQGTPLAVALQDKTAWVLSGARVYTAAKSLTELYSKSAPGALGAVDVTSPENAWAMGGASIRLPFAPVALAVRGSRAFVVANGTSFEHVDVAGEGEGALFVFDLSNKSSPTYVGEVTFPGTAQAIALVGDLALIAAGSAGLQVLSIANPDRPLLLGAKQNFLMAGVSGPVAVEKVAASGSHALLHATRGTLASTLIVDLATSSFSVVGELSGSFGEMDIRGPQALSASRSLRTVSLVPSSRPYVQAVVPSLMRSGLFVGGAVQPHVMAAITSPISPVGSPASLQLVEASNMAAPQSIDALDLYPATNLSDVDIDGDVAVATISATHQGAAQDGLAVVRLPFPVVVASSPRNGEEHVRPTESVRLTFNVPISLGDEGDSSVRLSELNGSSEGLDVTGAVGVSGNTLTVMPSSNELGLNTRYRLTIQGVREATGEDAGSGAVMPGTYVLEFTTAGARDAVQMTITRLSVREGPVGGGTEMKIEGSGFTQGLTVAFNGRPADNPDISEDGTEISLLTPRGAEGAATLELKSTAGHSTVLPGAFLYTRELMLTSLAPARGPTSGGTRVIIEGHGFSVTGHVTVRFNGVEAQRVRVLGLNRLEAYTPNGVAGPAHVTVQNPDGESSTLPAAFTYDAPTGASVALEGTLRDAVVIGSYAYVVGSHGLHVVDMSGVYTPGSQTGQSAPIPIPPDRQAEVVDEDGIVGDDRIVGTASGGDLWAVSYPDTGGDRLFASGVATRDDEKGIVVGGIYEFDISDPAKPQLISERTIPDAGVYDVDARGDRLLAAAASAGFHTFDISHEPFPIRDFASDPGAQAVALEAGLAVAGVGTRTSSGEVAGGSLRTLSVEGPLTVQGMLDVNVQRVRLRGTLAAVAAGHDGLVLVDVSDPCNPQQLGEIDVGGFANDVRLVGSLAYVSAGAAGVAVVDVTAPRSPQLLHHVTGAHAGSTFAATVTPGGRVVSLRQRAVGGGWSLDFGPGTELSVVSASVSPGQVVPLNLSSITVTLSTVVNADTVESAFQLTAGGMLVEGDLEAGNVEEGRSTIVFRLTEPLPANAPMHLRLSEALENTAGKPLVAPFEVEFWSALAEGGSPRIAQMLPRVGPVSGGGTSELLGFEFDTSTQVSIGGKPADVLTRSSTRLTVKVPPGEPGLADVVVWNQSSGLSARRAGGYLYTLPLSIRSATPQFLNPRGGSTVDITGEGFLPAWAHALGSTQVRVRGIPATQVQVLSLTRMRAVAGPGSFGDAPIVVVGPDGIERSTAPDRVGYGLPFLGEEQALSVRPGALSRSPLSPFYIYAAAGSSVSGNRFEQEYQGILTGGGLVPQSYRMASFDVQLATRPRAAGAQVVDPPDALVDRLVAVLQRRLPSGTPLPDVELMPDSLDVAISGDTLYVANGQSGLSVMDGRGTSEQPDGSLESLKLLGRAKLGSSDEGLLASRVVPTPVGAWVLANGLKVDPALPPSSFCTPIQPLIGAKGALSLIDARNPADPLVVSHIAGGEDFQPFGATMKDGRLYVVTGEHQGVQYVKCDPAQPMPPAPYQSLDYGQRTAYKNRDALPTNHRLFIYGSAGADAQVVGSIALDGNLTDVVVHDGVAIVASAEYGLTFVDVTVPEALKVIKRINFDSHLSNNPGQPQRLRLVGDVLFVSASEGGVVLVDVSKREDPVLLSGGNSEFALDVLPVGDRLMLAGKSRLTELETPFMLVTGYSPARGATVPPSVPQLVVQMNRPIAASRVTSDSVRLLGPDGVSIPLDLAIRDNPGQLDYAIVATLGAALAPESEYRLEVDTTVTDQRGGALLVPLRTHFRTGKANARQPIFAAVSAVSPTTVSTSGGQEVVVRGSGLAGVSTVKLSSNLQASITSRSETELRFTLPALNAGPIDLWVIDEGLPQAYLPAGLLALEPFAGPAAISPDHGPVEGKTRVRVSMPVRAVAPGTTVRVGNELAVDVDVLNLSSLEFTTPAATGAGIAMIELVPPCDEGSAAPCPEPVAVGAFSYDLPIGVSMALPGFPPRTASDIKLVGDKLYVGVSTPGQAGLEIFDVRLAERPLRLGGLSTQSPVRGLDVDGALALLANDLAGLAVVDVTHPETPVLMRQVSTGSAAPGAGRATAVRIEGTQAFVTTVDSTVATGNVQVFDVSSPVLPVLETVPLDADALALDLGPGRLFALTSNIVETQGDGLFLSVYDRQGARLGGIAVDTAISSYEALVRSRLVVRADRAYVTVGSRLYVFNLSNLADIELLQDSEVGAGLAGMGWAAGTLFVATSGPNTVQVVPPNELLAVGMTPVPGGQAMPGTHVKVDFTLPVLKASITSETATVTVARAGQILTAAGEWHVEYAVRGSSVIFTPSAPFTPGDEVTVVLDGLDSFDQLPQAAAFVGTFEVVDGNALQPTLKTLEPASGRADEETLVEIEGSGFRQGTITSPGTIVLVGGQVASRNVNAAGTSMTVTVPAAPKVNGIHAAGPAAVEVIDPSGLRALRLGGFVYREPLELLSLSPTRSAQQGGTRVRLQGRGFAPGMQVSFGGTYAFDVRVLSSQSAEVVAPPHAAGLVDVIAHVGSDESPLTGAFLYGAGAVARLSTAPIRDVVVESGVAYAALGAIVDIHDVNGGPPLQANRKTSNGGLLVANLSDPTHVTVISELDFPGAGGSRRVLKRGGTVYVAAGEGGVRSVDVSTPGDIEDPVPPLEVSGAASDIALGDSLLFVGDAEGVKVFDLGNGSQRPLRVGSRAIPGGVSALALYGPNLLVSSAASGAPSLYVLDARTGDLSTRGTVALSAPAVHITVEGTRAFLSLGKAKQVAIYQLLDVQNPATAGTLMVEGVVGGWASAEQTHVAGGVAYVAAGGGKVLRFSVREGQAPTQLGRATVVGDARTLSFMGRYLLVGTLVLDRNGTPVELPVSDPVDAGLPLAGALASVELDTLDIRGTHPRDGDIVAPGDVAQVLLTALPDASSVGEVKLVRRDSGEEVPVARQALSDAQGGQVVLTPYAPLARDTAYELQIGAGLKDLRGATLGTQGRVRFRTSRDAVQERPEIASVSPGYGLASGGNEAEVLGSGFLSGCTVTIGGVQAPVQELAADGRRIRVLVPAGKAGAAAVEVTNPGGLSHLRLGAYRYLAAPTVADVQPRHAAYNSRSVVKLTGEGLFPGSLVHFDAKPARSVTMDDTGALLVEVPDQVIGRVALTVQTPGAPPQQATLPGGFTFTLAERSHLDNMGPVLVRRGHRVFAARDGWLSVVDFSVAGSPEPMGDAVHGVNDPVDMAIHGEDLFLAGRREIVRYSVSDVVCSPAPKAPCSPVEQERLPFAPASGFELTAVAAGGAGAYVAIADGNELALMAPVDGAYVTVARTFLGSGKVIDLDVVDGALLLLIQDGSDSRLEVRSTEGSSLPLIDDIPGLGSSMGAMTREGSRVVVSAGTQLHLIDVTSVDAPQILASAVDPNGGLSKTLALSGPWLIAANGNRVSWLDTTQGLVERTFASTPGTVSGAAILNGVAVVSASGSLRVLELPYPTVDTLSPLPGAPIARNGSASVTLPSELPGSVAAASSLQLWDGALPVGGNAGHSGSSLSFVPTGELDLGKTYVARLTLEPMPLVTGGHLLGAWDYVLRAGGAPTSLRVDDVEPATGPMAGGIQVTVSGVGFDEGTTVQIGGVEATRVGDAQDGVLTVVLPSSAAPGPALVRVMGGNGASAVAASPFVYVAPMSFVDVSPRAVDVEGGWVHISGTGFHRGLEVRFDGSRAVTEDNLATSVRAFVPKGDIRHLALTLSQPGAEPLQIPKAVYRGDVRAPEVERVDPMAMVGSQNVPLASVFEVRFDEPLSTESGSLLQLRLNASDIAIPGVSQLLADGRTLRFTPTANLASTTWYALTATGVTDAVGNVASPFRQNFRTVDTTKPTLQLQRAGGTVVLERDSFAAGVFWSFHVAATDDSRQSVTTTFSVNGTPVPSASNGAYVYRWPLDEVGTRQLLTATATDSSGNISAPVEVVIHVVEDSPPEVRIQQPVADVTREEGGSEPVVVTALDNAVVTAVELHVDGIPWAKLDGLTQASAALTRDIPLARIKGSAASEQRVLTAYATDNKGQVTASAPRVITVTRDAVPPSVQLRTPVAGGKVAGGASLAIEALASDSNGIAEVEFFVDDASVGLVRNTPWRVTWQAPVVSSAQTHLVRVVARDFRENEADASASFTVEPSPVRPFAQVTSPDAGTQLQEGRPFGVTVKAVSVASVASVRITAGSEEHVLTQAPWVTEFRAPVLDGGTAPLELTAQVTDVAGASSLVSRVMVSVVDDGQSEVNVALAQEPDGPLLLGGSMLTLAGETDAGVLPELSVSVADTTVHVQRVAGIPVGEARLPEEPEGAPVITRASLQAPGGASSVAERQGSLAVLSMGETDAVEDALDFMEPVALVSRGDSVLVVRSDGGGGGALELRSRQSGTRVASRSFTGTPVGAVFAGNEVVVAIRKRGAGALERFSLPGLEHQPLESTPLVRAPTALDGARNWLAVATDQGVELRHVDGALASRILMRPVLALSAEGSRLFAMTATELVAVDVTAAHAHRELARLPLDGAPYKAVAALGNGGVCVAGTEVRCFAVAETGGAQAEWLARGSVSLGAEALNALAFGELLSVGTPSGARVLDVRETVMGAGLYPAVKGLAALVPGALVGGTSQGLSHLAVIRGPMTPRVAFQLPATARQGARVTVDASVSDDAIPLNGFTAELSVNGVVVETRDTSLPQWIDMPSTGDSATVELAVRDLAGRQVVLKREVTLTEPGPADGPALADVRLPAEVPEGAYFPIVALPEAPAQVAQVEVTLAGGAPIILTAPRLAGELRAPMVSAGAPTSVQVTFVALDVQGRRGAPLTRTLLVHDDPGASIPVVSVLRRAQGDTTPIYEGTFVTIEAAVEGGTGGEIIVLSVDGLEAGRAKGAQLLMPVRTPLGDGARTVTVTAVARDAAGRESAPATLALVVVDDLTPPVLTSIKTDPEGEFIAAGSELIASVEAADGVALERVSIELSIDEVRQAGGGKELRYEIPENAAPGTLLSLTAIAEDAAGNISTVSATRTVTGGARPHEVASVSLDGASQIIRRGDLVYVTTSIGLWIGQVSGNVHAPTVTQLASFPTPVPPVGLAVLDQLSALALEGHGLWFVDVSVPSTPRLVSRLPGMYNSVASSKIFYATRNQSNWTYRFEEIDVGDPASPARSEWGNSSGPSRVLEALAEGPIVTHSASQVVVPIVNDLGEVHSRIIDVPNEQIRAVARDGDLIVVGTEQSLHAWVRVDANHVHAKARVLSLTSGVRSLKVIRGVAYIACDDGWLRMVDYREPSDPRVVSRIKLDVLDLQLSGGLLFAVGPSGLQVLRLPAPTSGQPTGAVPVQHVAFGLAPFRGGVVVANGASGVQYIDVAGGAEPSLRGTALSGANIHQVESLGRNVFALDDKSLRIAETSASIGGQLQWLTSRSGALQQALGPVDRFSVALDRIWAISSSGTLRSVNWPAVTGSQTLAFGRSVLDVTGDESRALVAMGTNGVAVVEVAPSGQLIQTAVLPVSASFVALDGHLALAGSEKSVSIFELRDGDSPELVGTLSTLGDVQRIRLEGRLALISEGAAGVEVWHLPEGGPAERVAHLAETNAQDAVLASGRIVVADSTVGVSGSVRTYTPPDAVTPSVRIHTPKGFMALEAGSEFNLHALARGVRVDAAELLVDGRPVAAIDEMSLSGAWMVDPRSSAGQSHFVQVRVRDAGGTIATSPPVEISVQPPSTELPTLRVTVPSSGADIYSGAVVSVSAEKGGGLPPFRVTARLGATYLGQLHSVPGDASKFEGAFQAPIFDTSESIPLTVVMTEGGGRMVEASVPVDVFRDIQPPGMPSGLPAQVRAGPFVNQLVLKGTDDGILWLELEQDGKLIAVSPQVRSSVTFNHSLLLPEEAVGQSLSLVLTAVDLAGRRTSVSQSYTVLPDGTAPAVTFAASSPPTSASEGTVVTVTATANDADRDVSNVRIFADGVEIGSSNSTSLSVSYTLPRLSERPSVHFRAVATDSRGRTGSDERTTVLAANPLPVIDAWILPISPIQRETVRACVQATDNVGVVTLTATADDVPLEERVSCGERCQRRCANVTLGASATQLLVTATATDSLGAVVHFSRTYSVGANRPPAVTLNPITYMLVGEEREFIGYVVDERTPLAWAEFRVNGIALGERFIAPATSANLRRRFTPIAGGVARISLVAQDQHGQVTEVHQDVLVLDARYPADVTSTIAADDMRFEGQDIIIRSGQTIRIDGVHAFRNLYVLQNAVVTHGPQDGEVRNVMDLTVSNEANIYQGGKIDVSGRGYLGGRQPGNSDRSGKTLGNEPTEFDSAGGSHGGFGKAIPRADGAVAVATYGDYRNPAELGAGGAGGEASDVLGGNGGGLIRLKAATLRLDGELLANAEGGSTLNASYGGAGGGIRVEAGALTGTGSIKANGAGRATAYGGGGGRVAIYYDSAVSSFDWSKVEAKGQYASAGTVFLKGTAQEYGELILATDAGGLLHFNDRAKPTRVDGGIFDRFVAFGHGDVEVMGPLTTDTLEIERGVRATFHGEVTGAVASLHVDGASQMTLRQPWAFQPDISVEITGQLAVVGGAPLRLSSLKLTGSYPVLRQERSLDNQPRPLEIVVNGHVDLVGGASIDVSGQGYLGGGREGNPDPSGLTHGNVPSGRVGAAGSHGGYGRMTYPLSQGEPVAVYGDYKMPLTFGAGGSLGNVDAGGNGGGVLHLTAASMRLNGNLYANGSGRAVGGFYGGAGGSVLVNVGALTGSGIISARGGSNWAGGGRIAVYYDASASSFSWNGTSANGADEGGTGTVYLKALQDEYGDIVFDNGTRKPDPTRVRPTELFGTPEGVQTFRNFTVKGGASVFTPDALDVRGALTVDMNSRLQSQNIIRP
ncbi:hypothetical protein MVI01_34480 [Myxococcus virescens]|uniref:IPT/TIG domain-containing protein n=1 Tax=Myxococcus virescens TaxID=83456 RepID=A0A511HE18_9BACT|nr:hypothetical protein MVI01_34480 [Myxococcus virescens]